MMVNSDFDGLHRSWQCLYHFVIADFSYQNCVWSLFEHIWCSHGLCRERHVWEVLEAGQKNVEYLNTISFAAVLNESVDRDARAERCEVSAWHGPWELHQGRLYFSWDIHGYFAFMSNASDPVSRKWLAPGSLWICICFMSLFPPCLRMEAVLFLG